MATNTVAKSSRSKSSNVSNKKQSFSFSSKLIGLLAALLVVVLGYVIVNSYANEGVKLYLTPATGTFNASQEVEFEVWAETGDIAVNAVQADLSYPTDKFSFKSIDGTSSSFSIDASSTGGSGKISIVRGNVQPVTGTVLVGKFTLQAVAPKGKTTSSTETINFTEESQLLSASDNKNVLTTTEPGIYTVTSTKAPRAENSLTLF